MRIFSRLLGIMLLVASAGTAQAVVFKIATLSPDGSIWMRALRTAATDIAERTDGRVNFKFYPGGVMGDDKAVMRKIRVGQLHGAVLTAGGLVQTYSDIQLYNIPMLFRTLEEVDHVRAAMDAQLLEGLERNGFVAFGIAEVGFAYAMSKVPVTSVSDVQAQKVWVPDGDPGAERTLASFDVRPIPLSIADVLGGLQTGLINGVAVPPVAAIALQWHTQLDYVLDLPLLYVYGTFVISKRQFDKLEPADQMVVRTVLGDLVREVNRRNRQDHERAKEALLAQGLSLKHPGHGEIAEWRNYARQASTDLVTSGLLSEPLYDDLMSCLNEYRDGVD